MPRTERCGALTLLALLVCCAPTAVAVDSLAVGRPVAVGVAAIDITPETPVRLYGYASRKTESEGVAGRLHAKALVIGIDSPAVLLSVDCGAVPATLAAEVLARLQKKAPLVPERFVLCNTHNHSGPNLKGAATLPVEERERLEQYGAMLTARLEKVVLRALDARRPAHLAVAEGSVSFAANRRVLTDGKWSGFGAVLNAPADHRLPVLRITDTDGKLMAVAVNYACHCTTLRANFMEVHGDWAGCAQRYIEADHPGALALISIGCGADADPHPHGTVERAEQHGRAVAVEVTRLLAGDFDLLSPELVTRRTTLRFVGGTAASSAEDTSDHERDDIPFSLDYPITTWQFGDDLAMVFLTGEVVVDYARRLRRALPRYRLWLTAYAHEVPCYVVSERLIAEGGYEVRNSISARVSGGHPEAVTPSIEDRIVAAVQELLKSQNSTR